MPVVKGSQKNMFDFFKGGKAGQKASAPAATEQAAGNQDLAHVAAKELQQEGATASVDPRQQPTQSKALVVVVRGAQSLKLRISLSVLKGRGFGEKIVNSSTSCTDASETSSKKKKRKKKKRKRSKDKDSKPRELGDADTTLAAEKQASDNDSDDKLTAGNVEEEEKDTAAENEPSADEGVEKDEDVEEGGGAEDPEKTYCLCRQPFDEAREMIGCDKCDEWYHWECITMTPQEVYKTRISLSLLFFSQKCLCVCRSPTSRVITVTNAS